MKGILVSWFSCVFLCYATGDSVGTTTLGAIHKFMNQKFDEVDTFLQSSVADTIAEMDDKFMRKFGELETQISAKNLEVQRGLELQQQRDLQRTIWNNKTCSVDHITELQTNFSTELQKMEKSLEGYSSVEQLSNLTMLLAKDECVEGFHGCSPLAVCEDTIVSYKCICLLGYAGDGFSCEDVDECATAENRCHDHGQCSNMMGNYTCTCNQGFSGDGFICEDDDECTTDANSCHNDAECKNSLGSYTCTCKPGYSGDGFSCEDDDECTTDDNSCHNDAECKNSLGSYICTCNPGFSGDGFNCENMCVSPYDWMPSLGCVTIVRRNMKWEDARQNCINQGGRLLQGITNYDELQ